MVAALVEAALADPEGATDEGAQASAQLEEMAWAAGWSKEQTAGAADWSEVGDMALAPPTTAPLTQPAAAPATPTPPDGAVTIAGRFYPVKDLVGCKFYFAKRSKDGAKLHNNKGEEFPAQEVEVVAVDAAAKTCTVKTTKDGKPVVDIRSKAPVAVKFEWLETLPY